MKNEHLTIMERWTEQTMAVLRYELKKNNVGMSNQLRRSLGHKVTQQGDMVETQLNFLVRGRFVDMGAGKKRRLSESREDNRKRLTKPRRPKVWYSRAFYGRLNDLQGAIGYKLMESAVNSIKNEIDNSMT